MNGSQSLSVSPPFVNLEPPLFLSKETGFYVDVVEVCLKGASGVFHSNYVSLQSDVHIFWNASSLIARMVFILTVDAAKRKCFLNPVFQYQFSKNKATMKSSAEPDGTELPGVITGN